MTFAPAFLAGAVTAWMPAVALLLAWSIRIQTQSTIAACSALTDPAAQLRTALAGIARIIVANAAPIAVSAAATAWLVDTGRVDWPGLSSHTIDHLAGLYPSGIIPIVPAERTVTDPPSMIVLAVGQLGLFLILALLLIARRQLWELLHRLLAAYALKSGIVEKNPGFEASSLPALLSANAAYLAPVFWYALNGICLWRTDAPALWPLLVGAPTFLAMVASLTAIIAWIAALAVQDRIYADTPSFPSQITNPRK